MCWVLQFPIDRSTQASLRCWRVSQDLMEMSLKLSSFSKMKRFRSHLRESKFSSYSFYVLSPCFIIKMLKFCKERVPLSQVIFWMAQVNSLVLKTITSSSFSFFPQILSCLFMYYFFCQNFEMSASRESMNNNTES